MSTIETLAMAIDAKDQITHGHIRRVQSFAVNLATRVGISDSHLTKAIEAAALLHDTGKLAVPEYILNSPEDSHQLNSRDETARKRRCGHIVRIDFHIRLSLSCVIIMRTGMGQAIQAA